jgi:heme-degrading monooxygenase HmoA
VERPLTVALRNYRLIQNVKPAIQKDKPVNVWMDYPVAPWDAPSAFTERMVKMSIDVLIKREFVEEKAQAVAPLMVKLRSIAKSKPGYICSASLRCIEPPDEKGYLIRSTWESVEDWKNWFHSEERSAIQRQIDAIAGVKTEYRIYEPLVDGFFEKLH